MIKESEKLSVSETEMPVFEGMTSINAVLNSIESGASDRRIIRVLVDKTKLKSKSHEIDFLKRKSSEHGFPLEFTDAPVIDDMCVGNSHGGIIAECSLCSYPELTASAIKPGGFYIYLDGIEDPYNFGYTVRSLYAAGADGIILPPRNWMSAAGLVARSSAGTSELSEIYVSDGDQAVKLLRSAGYIIASAGIRDSISIYQAELKLPLLLIIGGEKRGISRTMLDNSNMILRIDYGRNFRGSLSSASAAAVMAFEIMRQNKIVSDT